MPDSITLRPQTEHDLPFVFGLYASTRADEMRIAPWNDQQKRAFVEMQFHAQKTHYETHYPACSFSIIERNGEPVGRLYVNRTGDDIRVIDITISPECRSAGLGSRLLRELLDEGIATKRKVSIHVESFNPALRLYERLGFKQVSVYGVYYLMERSADEAA